MKKDINVFKLKLLNRLLIIGITHNKYRDLLITPRRRVLAYLMDASYLNQYIVTVCHSSGRFAKNRKPNTHNSDSKVLPSAYRGEIALLSLSIL